MGGIRSVEFLQKIKAWRSRHRLAERPLPWVDGPDVWAQGDSSGIRVCVRKRPMLQTELRAHDFDVVSIGPGPARLTVHEPRTRVDLCKEIESHGFGVDAVFSEADGNDTIYRATLAPLLPHVLAGGSATVFAFGQTGSGKTCTMAGHHDPHRGDGNDQGLCDLAAEELVAAASARGASVHVAFFEVYRGQVLDLLGQRARVEPLEDAQGCVHLVGLTELEVGGAAELLDLVRKAEQLRATGATSANETSSRSHAILQVSLRKAGTGRAAGRLSLVDLAGSERAADSSSKDRQTRLEGAEINRSLLCLKECIRSLGDASAHVPFRGSKLTQVLRDAFVGKARTVMLATVSPGSSAAEHTLDTLRYAARVRDFSARRASAPVAVLPPLPPPPMPPLPPPPARAPRAAAQHAMEGTKVFGTPHAPKLAMAADARGGAASAAGACTGAGAASPGGLGETKVHW